MTNLIQKNGMKAQIARIFNAPVRLYTAVMAYLTSALMVCAPSLAVTIKGNLDMDTVFGNMADIIIKIAFYVGAMVVIGGIFQMVLAYKDDNADGQTRAIRLIVVGVALIGFESLLKLGGIVS